MEFLKAYLDYAVFGILGLMGFIALWITFERFFYYRSVKWQEFSHHEHLNIALSRNLTSLSIIGANAPYVGLLGTVLGILITFYDLGQGHDLDTGAIMLGLALALKATAAGIAIAIPSIMFYNGLVRKVDVINAQYRAMQDGKRDLSA
ncbi:TonB-system energizer ExbB [Thiomicrorhabdus sp. 6S2-11]|jgi:biopolymer transport protein ExbB|uniref:TonB-system energizer ExbB n=1 Tax=Thiomicrorhabdus marina TaxID=2818442 RepID=A0ABS3Q6Z7_9GAMM|nr:TonB-system energizer ExbB [Thiomicrorhabdus marina]MBO1927848.1 TonB-system energizer ExbB [Thiomicrorhabdus marina]